MYLAISLFLVLVILLIFVSIKNKPKEKDGKRYILTIFFTIFITIMIALCFKNKFDIDKDTNVSLQVVASRYKEDMSWTKKNEFTKLNIDLVVYQHSLNPGPLNVLNPNNCAEWPGWITFIINNYDTLKDWTMFIHAHETHWHHPESIVKTIKKYKFLKLNGDKKYININFDEDGNKIIYNKIQPAETVWSDSDFNDAWNFIFPNDKVPIRKKKFPGCGMCIVHREKITSRTKNFYVNLLKFVNNHPLSAIKISNRKKEEVSERGVGALFLESNWHYIMGEEYDYQEN